MRPRASPRAGCVRICAYGLRAHLRDGALAAEKDALGVDRHRPLPVRLAGLQERRAGAGERGVVDHDVERAEARDGQRHQRLDLAEVGHVAALEKRGPAGFGDDLVGGLAACLRPGGDVADDDVGALAGEEAGDRATDAARRARDHRRPAVQSHRCSAFSPKVPSAAAGLAA